MRLERIRVGDLVLCRIKGRSVYGEVMEVSDGRVNFRPLCPAAGWHHASAREIVSHWRKTGHRTPAADARDEAPRPPLQQLSLPGVHP
jgi:translation initiation factor 2 gamma subunit (eIF-2gamma)